MKTYTLLNLKHDGDLEAQARTVLGHLTLGKHVSIEVLSETKVRATVSDEPVRPVMQFTKETTAEERAEFIEAFNDAHAQADVEHHVTILPTEEGTLTLDGGTTLPAEETPKRKRKPKGDQ